MWRPLLGPMERMKNTAKPPVNDHPKCKGLVVAYGRVITYDKRNTRGLFLEEDRAQYIFKRIAHAVSKLWYVYFHVVTKITPYSLCSVIYGEYRDQTVSLRVRLQGDKNNWNFWGRHPESGRGRFFVFCERL